jgi:hypothetical protein
MQFLAHYGTYINIPAATTHFFPILDGNVQWNYVIQPEKKFTKLFSLFFLNNLYLFSSVNGVLAMQL